jgi:hypothetical protein
MDEGVESALQIVGSRSTTPGSSTASSRRSGPSKKTKNGRGAVHPRPPRARSATIEQFALSGSQLATGASAANGGTGNGGRPWSGSLRRNGSAKSSRSLAASIDRAEASGSQLNVKLQGSQQHPVFRKGEPPDRRSGTHTCCSCVANKLPAKGQDCTELDNHRAVA